MFIMQTFQRAEKEREFSTRKVYVLFVSVLDHEHLKGTAQWLSAGGRRGRGMRTLYSKGISGTSPGPSGRPGHSQT